MYYCRVAVPSRPPPDVSPGYPAVPERPQDIVQHPAGAAVLYLHCCVAHWRWYHSPGKYMPNGWHSLMVFAFLIRCSLGS